MGCNRILAVLAFVLLAVGLAPVSARAQSHILCDAPTANAIEDAPVEAWHCARGELDLDASRNVVRLDVEQGTTPHFVISRAAKFSSISTGVITGNRIVWNTADFASVEATFFDRQFFVPLPDYTGNPDAVLVAVEHATQDTTFDHMRLEADLPGSSHADIALLMVVALLTGMMLMPILFDLVFYRILREKFILWHAALVACLATQLTCSFGLYAAFATVYLPTVRLVTIGSFALMVIAATMFTLRFIEPANRPRRLGRALYWMTGIFTVLSLIHMAGIEALGWWPATLYFLSGAPVGLTFIAVLGSALHRGSRTARFLAVGLAPLLLVALTRVASFILPGVPVVDANELLLVATIIEVAATALGVADRFLSIKHDRDRARGKVDVLEGEAQRDSLTGLMNRRVIDSRYEELRGQGFDTFALIDLDKFKDINDQHGHQVGDAVLVACAQAIRSEDRDLISIRLGGEEFVLLLRGAQSTQRAEELRQAIPRQIASDVPGLDRLVTASMGVLELPRDALGLMEFEDIYARADKLLYEAKASGRNRMMYERLTVFEPAPRKHAAA